MISSRFEMRMRRRVLGSDKSGVRQCIRRLPPSNCCTERPRQTCWSVAWSQATRVLGQNPNFRAGRSSSSAGNSQTEIAIGRVDPLGQFEAPRHHRSHVVQGAPEANPGLIGENEEGLMHEGGFMSDTLSAATLRLVGYYEAGDIGAKQYFVTDIPGALLSHVIYAFADVTATGDCVSVDAKDDGINFPQLVTLKATYPQLGVLISVGGASHSTDFPAVAADDGLRTQFAQSSVQFMTENGFDGIDIDWEFPDSGDSSNFTALLQALRTQLDAQGVADGRDYLLTIAAPAGPKNIANLQLAQIHPLLDWINLETYDFTTAHSAVTNFNAPLFTNKGDRSVDAAVKSYLTGGVPAEKIVMGVRFVGTGWTGVGSTNN